MKVEFQNVTYQRKKFCLQNLSFQIREGYLTALVGKNGAGKTTFMHLLLDMDAEYEGLILADGENWKQNQAARRSQIGFVSDEQRFFMECTALENANMIQWLYEDFSLERFAAVMERMALPADRKLKDLSRGEYMKYQLAFAIAHHTRLYLLDEATAGMDSVFKREFFQILHELLIEEGCTIFMSLHMPEDIQKHMDYIVQIEQGKIISDHEVGCGIKGKIISDHEVEYGIKGSIISDHEVGYGINGKRESGYGQGKKFDEAYRDVFKVKKFDEAYRDIFRDAFLYGKVSAGILCSIGAAFMIIPGEVLKYDPIGMAGCLFTGCLLSALGVQQYLLSYLSVRQDGKMMPLFEILKYMPVTKAQLRKVRLGYLNRFCLRLGAVTFALHQLASFLWHSFGWGSICSAVCQAVVVWLISLFLVRLSSL